MPERRLASLVLAALLVGACGRGAASSPVVASCANPDLPPELLDGPVSAPAAPLRVVTAAAGAVRLRLAVAADEPTRELGLMCVLRLRPQHGMIFVFDHAADWEFWMKNTLEPLDMVWVDDAGAVTSIAANVPASTRTAADADVARRRGRGKFVIELPAGEAASDGLTAGLRLGLPPLRSESHS